MNGIMELARRGDSDERFRKIAEAEGVTDYAPLFAALGMKETALDESDDFSFFQLADDQGNPLNSGADGFTFLLDILTRELSREEMDKDLASKLTKIMDPQ